MEENKVTPWNLGIHECMKVPSDDDVRCVCLRVPGGWIYETVVYSTKYGPVTTWVFVPFATEESHEETS